MRVRAYVQPAPRLEYRRADVIDENERSNAARLQGGDGATDLGAADVVQAGRDDDGPGVGRWWMRMVAGGAGP
jgi:hypothetical protein